MTDLYVDSFGQIIEIAVTLDGEPLDLTTAACELTFVAPSGSRITKSVQTSLGKATYVTERGLINESGRWHGILTVDLGDTLYQYPFDFAVQALP
jgi:hypothetical protein